MRQETKRRVRVVESATAKEFEDALNAVLDKVTMPDITFDPNQKFLAYVAYNETVDIPTTVRDHYVLRGEYHYCAECPYYQKAEGRKKFAVCQLNEFCSADQEACNVFYKMHNDGTLDKPKKVVYR